MGFLSSLYLVRYKVKDALVDKVMNIEIGILASFGSIPDYLERYEGKSVIVYEIRKIA